MVKGRSQIIHHYIFNILPYDIFLIFIPLIFILFSTKYKELSILILLRFIKKFSLIKNIEERIRFSEKFQYLLELMKLLFLILFSTHLTGCFLFYYSEKLTSFGNANTWYAINNFEIQSIWTKYINSIYYATLTMITVGFANTDNNEEKLAHTALIILTAGVFAYSINTIGNILTEIKKNEKEIKFINKIKVKLSFIII